MDGEPVDWYGKAVSCSNEMERGQRSSTSILSGASVYVSAAQIFMVSLPMSTNKLERIHSSFARLQYDRYLPCPCIECDAKAEPYGFALDKLRRMAAKGQSIQCYVSGEMINATWLVRVTRTRFASLCGASVRARLWSS
jgi:hypothetical protein